MLLSRMEKRKRRNKAIFVFAVFLYTLLEDVLCGHVCSCVFDTLFLLSIFNVGDERRGEKNNI